MTDTTSTPPDYTEILAAEYYYIADTANQAHEDRARVASFYLVAVGSLIAALFGTQYLQDEFSNFTVKIMFGGLFILLTFLGVSTVLQLVRLRTAWQESMDAMNQIKEYVIERNPDLAKAFRWRKRTLPNLYKPSSISYYQARDVASIGGLIFGIGVFFIQQAFLPAGTSPGPVHWLVSIVFAVAALFGQLQLYKRQLNNYAAKLRKATSDSPSTPA